MEYAEFRELALRIQAEHQGSEVVSQFARTTNGVSTELKTHLLSLVDSDKFQAVVAEVAQGIDEDLEAVAETR